MQRGANHRHRAVRALGGRPGQGSQEARSGESCNRRPPFLPSLSLADVDPSSQTNRLDSKGNRLGKVIDYAGSETRFMEMLDGLCSEALPNAVVFDGEGWVALTSDAKRKRANKEHPLRSGAQKQFKTTLGNFCQPTLCAPA